MLNLPLDGYSLLLTKKGLFLPEGVTSEYKKHNLVNISDYDQVVDTNLITLLGLIDFCKIGRDIC